MGFDGKFPSPPPDVEELDETALELDSVLDVDTALELVDSLKLDADEDGTILEKDTALELNVDAILETDTALELDVDAILETDTALELEVEATLDVEATLELTISEDELDEIDLSDDDCPVEVLSEDPPQAVRKTTIHPTKKALSVCLQKKDTIVD